ncbi:MAG: LD-carboxypeptidase [Sedimentibacter sp.]
MNKPKALKDGDKVAVVAPSSASDLQSVEKGEQKLKAMGLNPVMFPTCYTNYGHLSAPDIERARDINDAFKDESIKGIICLRGGYGSPRILNMLDYEMIAANSKVFVGFSDITALHIAFNQICCMTTFHGPMATSNFAKFNNDAVDFEPYTYESIRKSIFTNESLGEHINPKDEPLTSFYGGTAEGNLIGGNLTLLVSTMGSKYELDTRNKILFIEEINEPIYKIDRMLNTLALAGKFEQCAGVVFGTFVGCEREQKAYEGGLDLTLEEVINNTVVPFKKPIICNFKAGHSFPQPTLPLGTKVKIDADLNMVIFTESGCK